MNNIETNTSLESVLENKDQRKIFIDEIDALASKRGDKED